MVEYVQLTTIISSIKELIFKELALTWLVDQLPQKLTHSTKIFEKKMAANMH
jgi:hypothetical protein